MREEENIGQPDSDWIGATIIEERPTRAGRIIVFALCALFILSVLAYGAVDYWALGLQTIGALALGLLWLWDAAARQELRFSRSLLQLPILALILIGSAQLLPLRDVSGVDQMLSVPATAAISLDAGATRFFVVQLSVYLIYFAAALSFVNDQKRIRAVAVTMLVFGLAIAVFAIIQGFSSEGKIYWSRVTPAALPFGTYVNRHHFAALMNMFIALALGMLFAKAVEKEMWTLLIFAVVIMAIALIFTGSRGAMISLLGTVGFVALLSQIVAKRRREESSSARRKILLATGGLLLVFSLFGIVLALGGDAPLLRSVGIEQSGDDISNGRLHFWQTTWQIFLDNPIVGVGLDALGVAYTRYDTWNGFFRVERAHNDYLQVLAESGILGFVCLTVFLILLFRRGWQIVSSTRDSFRRGVALGALAGCFGIVVHSFFDFPLRTPANALVFLLLVALATVQISYPKLHRSRPRQQ